MILSPRDHWCLQLAFCALKRNVPLSSRHLSERPGSPSCQVLVNYTLKVCCKSAMIIAGTESAVYPFTSGLPCSITEIAIFVKQENVNTSSFCKTKKPSSHCWMISIVDTSLRDYIKIIAKCHQALCSIALCA